MKEPNDLETPCPGRRRLGLKRKTTTDTKVLYKSLEAELLLPEKENVAALEEVTTTPSDAKIQRTAASTTKCQPYRLALSKRLRESLTKRRLEFHLANETKSNDEEVIDVQDASCRDNETLTPSLTNEKNPTNDKENEDVSSKINDTLAVALVNENNPSNDKDTVETTTDQNREELIRRIKEAETKMLIKQRHEQQKRDDLQMDIDMWRNAFVLAMDELQQNLEPAMEISLILQNLKIPPDMIKYLNE